MLPIFWILVCATVCPNFGESRHIDETLVNFVINATSSMSSPSTITALLCVNDDDGFQFAKQLSRNSVMHTLWRSIEGLDPVVFASKIDHRHFFLLDLDCPGAIDILTKASENRMFVAPAQWLILQDLRSPNKLHENSSRKIENLISDDDVSWIYETFGNFTMYPDSNVILGRRLDEDFFRVLSSYRPSPQRDLILEDRGYWTRDEGLFLRNQHPASRRRRDLRQTELKSCLVVTNQDTFNHLEDYRDKHVDAVTKANYIWVLHLINRMNATVNFASSNTWGYRQKNGTWSGMIGMLDRRDIDLGGTATFFVSDRVGVVDYVQLYTPTWTKFIFRRPPLSYVRNLFTLPFGRNVWIAIGIFLVLVIGLLYLAMRWEFKMKTMKGSCKPHWSGNIDEEPSISNNLLVIIGAVSQQGSSYEPRAVPTRIIVLMLLLTTLSLYASYTANIVALLQSTATSIKTPRDLMNSALKIGVYDIVYNHHFFQAVQDTERKEFYENAIKGKKGVWMSLEEGISRVRKGLFAFHVEIGAGYQLMQETFEEDEKCGIHELDYLNLLRPLLIIQRQSPYREIIRVGALWIRETGLQYRETTRLYTEKPKCQGHNSFVSVGITECRAALLTIAYGIGVTFGVLLLEIMWHKWCVFARLIIAPKTVLKDDVKTEISVRTSTSSILPQNYS